MSGLGVVAGPIPKAQRLNTGSNAFNQLLGGGLPACAVTDIFGAPATGKTQFAFQCALFCSLESLQEDKPNTIFVDCGGSFRPERITEVAEAKGLSIKSQILDRISSISVRSVEEQCNANELVLSSERFDECRLLIIDDITTNFVAEFSGVTNGGEEPFVTRYYKLSSYIRKLVYISLVRRMSVLLTNSVRSRFSSAVRTQSEVETTGEIISEFALFRLHFTKQEKIRKATVVQPFVQNNYAEFNIEKKGIVP